MKIVMIYSPSNCYKPLQVSLFCWTLMLVLVKQLMVAI